MRDFEQRLLEEKNQLSERIDKLNNFLNSDKASSVNPEQLVLLKLQLPSMRIYEAILIERLGLLGL